MAVVAPIPSANVSTTVIVESGAAPKLANGEAYILRYRHRKEVLQHKVYLARYVYVAGNCLVNIHEDKTQ